MRNDLLVCCALILMALAVVTAQQRWDLIPLLFLLVGVIAAGDLYEHRNPLK